MTKLEKPVIREARQTDIHGRPWVVTLEPHGYLEVRPKGTREAHRLSFEAIYHEADRRAADHLRAEKAKQGRRARR